jgi:bacterioferritin (cytochrome b1)
LTEQTLVELLKEQLQIEKNFVVAVDSEIESVHNVAARLLLLETKKDSEKHALIIEGILQTVKKGESKPLWDTLQDSYVDKMVVRRKLENHVKTETAMMEHIEKELKEAKDEGIRLLLKHIADDEKKHHEILQTVIKEAYKIKP